MIQLNHFGAVFDRSKVLFLLGLGPAAIYCDLVAEERLPDQDRIDLERFAARLVLDEDFVPEQLVAKAADLVATGFDGPATLALAAEPADPAQLDRVEVERLFRDLLVEHHVQIPAPGEAGWVMAGWIAELMIDGALKPADGALRLWTLWRTCGQPGELSAMLQLHDAWEASVGAERTAVEREMVTYASEVLTVAERNNPPG